MAFLRSLDITGSALTAERYRSEVILQNIAGANVTRTAAGGPYRRKQVVFEERPLSFQDHVRHACIRNGYRKSGGVRVQQMVDSTNALKPVYDPHHPDADADGYVWYPNVDTTEEITDLMAASNAYEANLTALNVVKAMINKSLEMT
ncbi:MAG: flagellar basal body rod protein FlgC [Clostridiales bacterium]|nr:flagellar basal body rod protein FlgC [Clostridiales bacterium]